MENQTNSNVNQTKRRFIFVVKHKTSNNFVKKKRHQWPGDNLNGILGMEASCIVVVDIKFIAAIKIYGTKYVFDLKFLW